MNRLERITQELTELQVILEKCVGEGDDVPDDAPGIVSDAVDLLKDLIDFLVTDGDPYCLWCARQGKAAPHAHESNDHPDIPEAPKVPTDHCVWTMTAQHGKECHWVCSTHPSHTKTTYDGRG